MALGEKVDLEELGCWRLHADTRGLIDRFSRHRLKTRCMTFEPFPRIHAAHNMALPPGSAGGAAMRRRRKEAFFTFFAEKRTPFCDMRTIIASSSTGERFRRCVAALRTRSVQRIRAPNGKGVAEKNANNPLATVARLSAKPVARSSIPVLCDSYNVPICDCWTPAGFRRRQGAERKCAPGWS